MAARARRSPKMMPVVNFAATTPQKPVAPVVAGGASAPVPSLPEPEPAAGVAVEPLPVEGAGVDAPPPVAVVEARKFAGTFLLVWATFTWRGFPASGRAPASGGIVDSSTSTVYVPGPGRPT